MNSQTLKLPYTFVEVGQRADFPARLGRQVIVGGHDIALFHTSDDRFFALENRTPHHKGGPLTEGMVSGHYVYCPLRDLKINLIDGLVQEPDSGVVTTYPLRFEGEKILVGIPQAN